MIRGLLVLFALFVFAAPLAAQEPSPGQLRAAERLVAAMRLESSWGPGTEQTIRRMQQAVPDTGGPSAESARHVRELVEKQMRETREKLSWERVGPEYVRLYASLYTEDELGQLTAFYESPVGQKSIRLQPEFTGRMFDMILRLSAPAAPQ